MEAEKTGWANASAKFVFLFILAVNITGCTLLKSSVAALKSTAHFVPMGADQRVFAEPGGEDVAAIAAAEMANAIATVEREQYRPFAKPVEVYVTRDEESFAAFTGVPKEVRGAVIIKLFLSGGLRKEPERIKRILIHELSHLHLGQRLGIYGYNANLPSWFQEGLAVTVSGGGGAEKMSRPEAAKAILAGKGLKPEANGSFFFKKSAHSYGIKPPMFYRQSGMFVAWLKNLEASPFKAFLLSVEDGGDFAASFHAAFGVSVEDAWQRFAGQLKSQKQVPHADRLAPQGTGALCRQDRLPEIRVFRPDDDPPDHVDDQRADRPQGCGEITGWGQVEEFGRLICRM